VVSLSEVGLFDQHWTSYFIALWKAF